MKKVKALLALGLGAAAVLVLSGCGAMTPEKLAARVQQAMERTPYSQTETDLSLDMTLVDSATDIEMDLGLQIQGQTQTTYDPYTVYENLEMTVEMLGVRVPTAMEVYLLPEGEEMAAYTHTGDSWLRSSFGPVPQDFSLPILDLPARQLSLDQEGVQVNGTRAVCLRGVLTGEDVSQAVGQLFLGLEQNSLWGQDLFPQGELDQVPWEEVSAQIVLYIDPDSYLVLRQEVTIDGLEQALSGLVQDSGVSFQVGTASMAIDYTSYQPAEPCVLPEGAKEAAAQAQRLLEGNPDNGDGTYTIQESGYYTDVTAPEGYVLEHMDYDQVVFYSQELDRRVRYQMWVTADSNDLFFWDMVSQEQELYNADDGTDRMAKFETMRTDGFVFCVDGYTFQGAYSGNNRYAWANMDDGFCNWILVTIYDGGNTRDSTLTGEEIRGLLEQVSRHQQPAPQEEPALDLSGSLEL